MILTRKTLRELGPALQLSDIAKPTPQPWSKTECKRVHRWVLRKWERRCARCGRMEEIETR